MQFRHTLPTFPLICHHTRFKENTLKNERRLTGPFQSSLVAKDLQRKQEIKDQALQLGMTVRERVFPHQTEGKETPIHNQK